MTKRAHQVAFSFVAPLGKARASKTNYPWYGNELVGLLRGSQLYYLSGDHLGKPQQATNTSYAGRREAY